MSREAHVRFDGSGEGKFLPATLHHPLGPADQVPINIIRNARSLGHHVGLGVVAEHEANPVSVPTVELGGERQVGVAPKPHRAEPRLPAQSDRLVIRVRLRWREGRPYCFSW